MSRFDETQVAQWLDCRGMLCPMPIIELSKVARRVPEGTLLGLTGDDPALGGDLRAWTQSNRHSLLHIEHVGPVCRAVIQIC